MSGQRFIELEGVRVHNLRNINLKIRHNSLTVICGVSGSGKSSLAFDTLYSEGQRRYVETFSPSARQFLDRIERPAADRIVGLPPAIAIRQQMRADGPRNTLGTRSEVLDSLRILFSRVGRQFCPNCSQLVNAISAEAAASVTVERCRGSRIMIVALLPWTETQTEIVATLIRQGFTRTIEQGKTIRLETMTSWSANNPLAVVVDRLKADEASLSRISEAIVTAMRLSEGACTVLAEMDSEPSPELQELDGSSWYVLKFSSRQVCAACNRSFPALTTELLSFSSPLGACNACEGTGSIEEKTSQKSRGRKSAIGSQICSECSGNRLNADSASVQWGNQSLPKVAAMELGELVDWLSDRFAELTIPLRLALQPAFEHADRRLKFLIDSGLSYLSLDRSMKSLSGGEAQRVMLTSALGSGLINTLYVLDEPTTGLHTSDTDRIVKTIRHLQKSGNTLVVVEHDPSFILSADHVIEIGPGAGDDGGRVVFEGTPRELLQAATLTGEKLRQNQSRTRLPEPAPDLKAPEGKSLRTAIAGISKASVNETPESNAAARKRLAPECWLELKGICCHNIHNLVVRLPLGVFCAVTGVSGSGKSSLIADSLFPSLCQRLQIPYSGQASGSVEQIEGLSHIENVLLLDQSPVQRSRRSIPATWIGVFDDIRILLSETHEAKKRNYSRAMFSFNASSGGRCPVCEGRGVMTVAMQFLADIETPCEECGGRRFRPDVIEIRYRDRSVFDILNMTADEAFSFFNGHHRIQQRLNAVRQTGLGYLRLGQSLNTISGGEAQRLRVAALLAGIPLSEGDTSAENRKAATLTRFGRTLFLLDEPSSGLHMQDIDRLLNCIDFLLQTGHSVIVVDHDNFLISQADWQIEMGPGPGKLGGQVMRSERNL